MKDQYNREIDYIRISVTDRCNLRCKYCMPECGVADLGHSNILTFDEITTIVKACSKLGIKHVKVTGGEPLVRRGIADLIKQLKAVEGIETVTLTTNGILLKQMLTDLVEAGIDGINISLDTLEREKFKEITGSDKLIDVLAGIEECKKLAVENQNIIIKLNTVTLAHCNEDEIIAFARIVKSSKIDVRFIEMMPLGLGKDFEGYRQDFIMNKIESEFGKLQALSQDDKHGNGPAVYYRPEGFAGTIGFISAMSHQFCDHCNRVRLTAEGVLKPCLQYSTGIDLRAILRSSKGEDALRQAIEKGIFEKPKSHQFSSASIEDREEKLMSKIGG